MFKTKNKSLAKKFKTVNGSSFNQRRRDFAATKTCTEPLASIKKKRT